MTRRNVDSILLGLMALVVLATFALAQNKPGRGPTAPFRRVTVPGTADIHLAGQHNGTVLGNDSVPANAPVAIAVSQAGATITISATGATCNAPSACASSPNGGEGSGGVGGGSDFGLSSIAGFPINALVGVFVGGDTTSTPAAANANQISSPATPALGQVFLIGAGPHSFPVPKGAKQLFLGSSDTPGFNYNNEGSFAVTVSFETGPEHEAQGGRRGIEGP